VTGVLGLVAPVFALIALGYVAALRRLVSEEGLRGINDFAFWLCAPSLLFLAAASGGASLHGGRLEAVFFGAVLGVYAAVMVVARLAAGRNLAESGLLALNCVFGNTMMMGVPVVLAAFGPAGVAPAAALLGLHSLVLLPLTTVVAELGMSGGAPPLRVAGRTLAAVARNPIVVAVVLGNLWALALPAPSGAFHRLLEMLAAAMSPMLLFCLGASLRDFRIAEGWREALLVNAVKLVALPLAVLGVGRLVGLGPLELAVSVTLAAMPTGANAFLMSRRYALGMERAGAAVLLSTVLSVATLAVVLGFFAGVGR